MADWMDKQQKGVRKMIKRSVTEEIRIWLFDLAHGVLTDDAIVKGFLKHYALRGLKMDNVQKDICFYSGYRNDICKQAMDELTRAITDHADAPEPPESRTLAEVERIVECVRKGIPIEVDYYDGEMDNDPYVSRRYW